MILLNVSLFTEPTVGKLEEDARSCRNCKHLFSSGWCSSKVAAADMLHSLVVDPTDTAIGVFQVVHI